MNNKFGYFNYIKGGHSSIIKSIVENSNCQTYLELGIYDGETFETIVPLVKRAIGVDIKDLRKKKIGKFYKMSTDDFFKNFKDMIDIIFIDADHNYKSVIKDFENSLKLLNELGIIFLHDTDPMSKKYTDPGYCGDSYKIIEYILNQHPELNIVTLPVTIAGLSIVTRKSYSRVKCYNST